MTLCCRAASIEDLLVSAKEGNVAELRHVLDSGVDVNATDADGWSALKVAAASGHLDFVKLLLERGGNINITDNQGSTPLVMAAQEDKVNVARFLLEHGAKVSVQTKQGHSALIIAAYHGNAEMVALLLRYGAGIERVGRHDLNVYREDSFDSPLRNVLGDQAPVVDEGELNAAMSWAAKAKHAEVVRMLLRAKRCDQKLSAEKPLLDKSELCQAVHHGDVAKIQSLLQRRDLPMWELGFAVQLAEEEGLFDIAEMIRPTAERMARRVVTQLQWGTQLSTCLAQNDYTGASLLLSLGADTGDCLWLATSSGNYTNAALLLAYGADANRRAVAIDGTTPLEVAARNNHPEIFDLLVAHGAKLSDLSNNKSAVGWAARAGNPGLLRQLLDLGGSADSQSFDGRTALMEAAEVGNLECVQMLLTAKADINARSNQGYTALMLAVNRLHNEVAALLKKAGAQERPNVAPSPLIDSAKVGDVNALKSLLANGANPNATNSWGDTPLEDAVATRRYVAVNLLLDAGAKPSDGGPSEKASAGAELFELPTIYRLVYYGDDSFEEVALLKRLLAAGVNINAPNGYSHQTALMAAAAHGYANSAKALLTAGARLDIKDDRGRTAVDLAEQAGHLNLVAYFRQAQSTR
jgi:ankyrin